jgi:hypothetical protein
MKQRYGNNSNLAENMKQHVSSFDQRTHPIASPSFNKENLTVPQQPRKMSGTG